VIGEEVATYNRAAVMDNRPRIPESNAFVQWVENALLHYGPLTPALRDPDVEDVFVDGPDRISVVRGGRQVLTPLAFEDEAQLLAVLKKLAAEAGRRIDEGSPMVEGQLPDGARLHAVIPPVARPWPYLTIRKFPERLRRVSALIADEVISEQAATFLVGALRAGANVLVAGATGAGKTTLLNALLAELPGRVVVIEETAELKVDEIPLGVALQGRPANVEGVGEIHLRPLVRAALRMRPQRIVVGEARGGEAFDLLQAMNTGHPGSLATLHANAPRDALERLVTMAAQAGEHLPDSTLRRMVVQTIGLVAFLHFEEGHRRVQEIWELAGLEADQFLGHAVFSRLGGRLVRSGLPSRWEMPIGETPANGAVLGFHK
jgi:pilus assembly protein CpaF